MGLRNKDEYQKAVKRLVLLYTKQNRSDEETNEINRLLFSTSRFEEENEIV